MSEDLQNINYLENLGKRVVRNAKPGNKNNPDAGLLYVSTESPSDGQNAKEYMLQAGYSPNTITVNACTFTEGSTTVFSSSSLTSVAIGDFVRPASKGGILYGVVEVNTSSLKLDKPFESETTTETCEVQKLKFGRVYYDTLENEVGTASYEFEYDRSKDLWVAQPGSNPEGPFSTSLDGAVTAMKDGISVHTLTNDIGSIPDMAVVGVLDKYLPLLSTDSNTVPFSPVPNPSNLTAPPDLGKLQVLMKRPTDINYRSLVYTQDYLLSYTSCPIFDGYRPLSDEASFANLHLLEDFESLETVTPSFDGSFNLMEGKSYVTNLYEDSITGTINRGYGETSIVPKEDFLTNPSTGVTVTIGHEEEESPVQQVFSFLDAFPNGLSVRLAPVPLGEASESDFEEAPFLQEGVGYAVNDNNGGFSFLQQIPPGSSVRIEYMVGGASQKEIYIIEKASDLRLNYFPIVPNTVKVSSFKGTRIRTLVEGEDFTLYYSNGIIVLNEEVARNTDSLTVQYSPATKMVCYAAPSEGNEILFRYIHSAVQVDSNRTVKVLMPGSSITFEKLVAHDGTIIPMGEVTPLGNNVYSLSQTSTKMAEANYAFADISLTSDSLAYSPLIRVRKRLPAGSTFVDLEGIPSTSLDITYGSIINFRSSADPSFREYSLVSSVENLDDVNTRVHLINALSAEVVFPLMYYTDAPATLYDVPLGVTLGSFGSGADNLVFSNAGQLDINLGFLISLGGVQVVSVTGVTRNGETVTVSITPSTRVSSEGVVGSIKTSSKPIYVEGDSALITRYPVVSMSVPVATLVDNSDPSVEIRHSVEIEDGTVKINRRQKYMEDSLIEIDTSSFITLKQVLEAIRSATSSEVSYTEIRDTSYISARSMADTVTAVNPHQVPLDIRATPTLSKKSGSGQYTVLERGSSPGLGDYAIVGGVITLSYPLVRGDRFKLTYTHSDNLGLSEGGEIVIRGKKFVGIPKDTSVRLVMDYLAPDQHMIQGMTELRFLDEVVYPYIEEQVKAQKGARSQGSQGVSVAPSSGPSEGGVYNNFMGLRDQWLSYNLLWKIAEYYKYRMGSFSKESEALQGLRFGNNDFSTTDSDLNRMSNLGDVEQQAALGGSVFYPQNFRGNTPKEDGRYSTSYAAYDQVYVYNTGGKGRMYGPHSEFVSGFRDILVGDTINLKGWSEDFTVESRQSNNTIVLAEEIPGAPGSLPSSVQEPGAFKGTSYSVTREGRSWSYVDDTGCAGCVVVAPRQTDTFVLTEEDKTFKLQMSEDGGNTWVSKTYTMDTGTPGIGYYSLESVATLLYNEMYDDFIVRAEEVYSWPQMSSEIGKALDITWPLPIPNTDGLETKRTAIVIRSRKNNVWVKFPQTGGVDLGISTTKVFKGQFNQTNCKTMAEYEENSRQLEKSYIEYGVLLTDNKLERGFTGPMGVLLPLSERNSSNATDHLAGITSAYTAAVEVMGETGMHPAYEQALSASETYQDYFYETQAVLSGDNSFVSKVGDSSVNKLINDVVTVTMTRTNINEELASIAGQPFITFQSPRPTHDGRVLMGDKTNSPSVLIGPNYTFENVFPFYTQNSSYLGSYVRTPRGEWAAGPTENGYSTGSNYSFFMSPAVTVSSSLLSSTVSSDEFNMYFDDGAGTVYTLSYGSYPSLASLSMAVSLLPGFSMSVVYEDPGESYGTLTPVPNPVSLSAPHTMYFGSRGDLSFFSISDYVLNTRVSDLDSRVASMADYANFYFLRGTQLENSFSEDGESLSANRQIWIGNLLNRIWGPANRVLPLKKTIKGV